MPRPAPLLTAPALLAALALALSGCTSAEEPVAAPTAVRVLEAGAVGEPSRPLDPSEVPDVARVPHTEADVAFVTDMVGHHAQAIVMTALVPDRSDDPALEEFVTRMDVSQVAEIEQMQAWLETRGEEVPAWDPVFGDRGGHSDGMAGMDMDAEMPGMATQSQMDELAAASGEDFDRLFLTMMTAHHEGALEMVDTLFAEGGGEEQEVFQIASHVISDQGIEIDRMAGMLAELDA